MNATTQAPQGQAEARRVLEVIDRQTGEVERIDSSDGNYVASIAQAAERVGRTYDEVLEALERGERVHSTGYIRRLVPLVPERHKSQADITQGLDRLARAIASLPEWAEVSWASASDDRIRIVLEVATFRRLFAGREVKRDDTELSLTEESPAFGRVVWACWDYSLREQSEPRPYVVPDAEQSS